MNKNPVFSDQVSDRKKNTAYEQMQLEVEPDTHTKKGSIVRAPTVQIVWNLLKQWRVPTKSQRRCGQMSTLACGWH